ncbi:MAG TPA: DEAD/DEAH box helicase [Firmicutes bacterium]|nr:DEAD/DEAH box helicase [Bacillota bacterium]
MGKKYVALDLETTGLNPLEDEIIEVAAVVYSEGRAEKEFTSLVKPSKPVPPSIALITGISQEILAGAPTAEAVLEELRPLLEGAMIVAHNAQFDLNFLEATARRLSVRGFEYEGVVDTLELSRLVLPVMRSHRLASIVSELNIPPSLQNHRALDDAKTTGLVFYSLLERIPKLGEELLLQLLDVMDGIPWPLRHLFEEALPDSKWVKRPVSGKSGLSVEGKASEVVSPPTQAPVSAKEIEGLLGPNGAALKVIPGFEFRPGQLQMAYLVLEAFSEARHMVIEAGTGSGKSLAYLVPAALWALRTGKKVVVATHTINLQEQLITKDIPMVEKLIRQRLNAAVVKGRSNYLCKRRWAHFLAELKTRTPRARRSALRLLSWAANTNTGDCSEISLTPEEEPLWREIAGNPRACMGGACAFRSSCYVMASREEAEKASIIVTNHAMLFADLATGNRVLPDYSYAVIDEAHNLEEAATHAFGGRVTSSELIETLEGLLRHPIIGKRLRDSGPLNVLEASRKALRTVSAETPQKSLAVAAQLRELATWLNELAEKESEPECQREALAASLELAERAGVMVRAIQCDDAREAGWVEGSGEDTVFSYAPLWVGETLAERFFDGLEGSVITSATLSVGGSLETFLRRTGLMMLPQERVHTEIVESPFNYESQALLCVPTDVAAPSGQEMADFREKAIDLVKGICDVCHGKSVVLFTSHAMMREFEARLRGPLMSNGINLLCQGIDGNRAAIAELFPKVQPAVVFGTASFWEGLDMPPGSLACVVIVKLPFEVPNLPLPNARARCVAEAGGNPFEELTLPNAVIRFKQGFGRLIRRQSDRGAVVVLDRRIVDSRYGRVFIDSLPQPTCYFASSREIIARIGEWLNGG